MARLHIRLDIALAPLVVDKPSTYVQCISHLFPPLGPVYFYAIDSMLLFLLFCCLLLHVGMFWFIYFFTVVVFLVGNISYNICFINFIIINICMQF